MTNAPSIVSYHEAPVSHAEIWRRVVAALDVQTAVQAAAAPFLDVALRIFLAQLVWGSGIAGLMHWQDRVTQSAPIAHVAAMSPHSAAVAQTGLELLLPGLLVLGLFVRPAALLITLAGLAAWRIESGGEIGLLCASLAFWFVASGPGPLSVDHLLARGIASSALPWAAAASRAKSLIGALLRPVALLVARLGPAVLLLHHGMAADWLTEASAIFLAAGLITRLATLPLFGVTAIAEMHSMSEVHLGFMLLLCLPAAFGPGALSLDHAVGLAVRRRVKRWREWQAARQATLPHVLIVGGGFGGLAAARGLRAAPCRVTLVDQRNYHLFQPLLYQVATASLSPADIATPIRNHFRSQPNVRVLLARVAGVDRAARQLVIQGGAPIGYDMLVLATGARHTYFGQESWASVAPGLKTIEDATDIRSRLLLAFEQAEAESDPAVRQALLTFAIVGGGPTGVELAGAIAELARHGLEGEFRAIDPAHARVILIQSADRLLPSFPPPLSDKAAASLRALGVDVRLGEKVDGMDAESFSAGGETIACRTIFWAAGVAASPAAEWLGAASDRAGRVIVADDLSVPDLPEVFVIGDTACVAMPDVGTVPGLAPAAVQGGAYVARVIGARLAGRRKPPPFRYRHDGSLATIGRTAAVADLGRVQLSGGLAWWFWGAVHILLLAGARNRLTVAVQWMWAYLTFGRGIRLITRKEGLLF